MRFCKPFSAESIKNEGTVLYRHGALNLYCEYLPHLSQVFWAASQSVTVSPSSKTSFVAMLQSSQQYPSSISLLSRGQNILLLTVFGIIASFNAGAHTPNILLAALHPTLCPPAAPQALPHGLQRHKWCNRWIRQPGSLQRGTGPLHAG